MHTIQFIFFLLENQSVSLVLLYELFPFIGTFYSCHLFVFKSVCWTFWEHCDVITTIGSVNRES